MHIREGVVRVVQIPTKVRHLLAWEIIGTVSAIQQELKTETHTLLR